MPVVDVAVPNPYTGQLRDFNAGITNARRGLIDLYKLRRQGYERHYNEMGTLYGAASTKTAQQYDASLKALKGFEAGGVTLARQSGYQLDQPDVAKAVAGIVGGGTAPFRSFLSSERGAQRAYFKGVKEAEKYEDRTLKTGLAREKPAALSELEQGIIDTQSNLQTQATAFAQQQAYNQALLGYQNQMLGYQRQMAMGAQGSGGGGGGSGKETPNTAQWLNYAQQRWGVTVGGWRAHGSVPNSDHPKGRAIDIMSSGSLGTSIANDFVSQAGSRGVSYVIWNGQIWTPGRGWHRYTGPNPHTDHVHVSFAY
jgi:hypothetical protein